MILLVRGSIYILLIVNLVFMMHLSIEYKRAVERSRLLSKLVSTHEEYQGELSRNNRTLVRCYGLQDHLRVSCGSTVDHFIKHLGLKNRNKYLTSMADSYRSIGPVEQ